MPTPVYQQWTAAPQEISGTSVMYEFHRKLTTPPDDAVIWRYLDFSKFLSLLATNSLYFCRCDKFEDKWDGSYSSFPDLLKMYPPNSNANLEIIRRALAFLQSIRECSFANCWHMSSDESAAMWEIYTARKSGIAIRSTIGHFKECFKDCLRSVFISQVVYGDISDPSLADHSNTFPPLFVKRKEYEFEAEVRAIIDSKLPPHQPLNSNEPDIAPDAPGYHCPINSQELIQEVVVAPNAHSKTADALRSILDRFGMPNIPVRLSKLSDTPPSLAQFDSTEPRIFTLKLRVESDFIHRILEACDDYYQKQLATHQTHSASIDMTNRI